MGCETPGGGGACQADLEWTEAAQWWAGLLCSSLAQGRALDSGSEARGGILEPRTQGSWDPGEGHAVPPSPGLSPDPGLDLVMTLASKGALIYPQPQP